MQHEDINHRTADHVQEKKARRHRPISNGHTGEGFRKEVSQSCDAQPSHPNFYFGLKWNKNLKRLLRSFQRVNGLNFPGVSNKNNRKDLPAPAATFGKKNVRRQI